MALTITVTESATNAVNGLIIVPVVLTGAQPKASQTATPKFVNATGTPFMDQSVTTTVTGSQVFGVITDGSNNNAVTADARTTILENFEDTVQAASYNAWRATALTTTPGATTLGFSLPTGDNAIYGALEILPNGSLAIDGSTPAPFTTNSAQTGTTASFTPPAGSLIVLLVGHCSSGVSPVPAITNTGGLTFSQAPGGTSWLSESFGTAVGVFLADVPGGAAGPAPGGSPQAHGPGWHPGRGLPGVPLGVPFLAARSAQPAAATTATVSGDVSFTETATITAAATDTVLGAAAVSETATITASGTSTLQAAATVAGTATVTAAATGTLGAAAAVAETATITAAATATELAAATLTGTVTITATITVGSATVNGDVSFTETATITAAATGIRQAAAAVTQTATVTAAATGVRQAAAAVAGTATITAAGTSTVRGAASVSSTTAITATLATAISVQNATSSPLVTAGQTSAAAVTGTPAVAAVAAAAASSATVTDPRDGSRQVSPATTSSPAVSDG